jgi:hypothetical protein
MSSVWVKLYYKGEAKPVRDADPIEIEPIPKNVNALKKKVKVEKQTKLNHVDAGDLKVYPSGTTVLESTESLDPGDPVPANTSSKMPLIVIAPKPEQPNGKLRCCSRILALFNCWFVEATNELTAFLLLL